MDKSTAVANQLAEILLERLYPDRAMLNAFTKIVEGFRSMERMGFSSQEILEAYKAERNK